MNLAESIKAQFNREEEISVNVICLVYNHKMYLRQALDSVLAQKTTYNYNIIIHDDASTDGSVEIIKEYSNKYPNIIIPIIREENLYQKGKSIWNEIYEKCDAKYIAVCEGDDYWVDEKKLQKQVDFLETHKEYSAVYGNIVPIDQNGIYNEKLRESYERVVMDRDYTQTEIYNYEMKTQTATLCGVNFYKYLGEKKREYTDIIHNEDGKWFFVYTHIGKVRCMSDELAAHRKVTDEGDSWSAIFSQLSICKQCKIRYLYEVSKEHMNMLLLSKSRVRWNLLVYNYLIIVKMYLKTHSSECLDTLKYMNNLKKIPKSRLILYGVSNSCLELLKRVK